MRQCESATSDDNNDGNDNEEEDASGHEIRLFCSEY